MIDNAHPASPLCIRPMGDQGILVEFGDRIDAAIHERMLSFDAQLRASPFHALRKAYRPMRRFMSATIVW